MVDANEDFGRRFKSIMKNETEMSANESHSQFSKNTLRFIENSILNHFKSRFDRDLIVNEKLYFRLLFCKIIYNHWRKII